MYTQNELVAQPRYFWRRFFALIIDALLFQIAIFILVLVVNPIVPFELRATFPIGHTQCANVIENQTLSEIADLTDPDRSAHRKYVICEHSFFGLNPARNILVRTETRAPGSNFSQYKQLNVPLTSNGKLDHAHSALDYVNLFLPLIMALFIFKYAATPGKLLLGLRVISDQRNVPFLRCMLREYLKVLPLLPLMLATAGLSLYFSNLELKQALITTVSLLSSPIYVIVLPALSIGLVIVWYVWPLLKWRNQMPYDRITNFYVIKKISASKQPITELVE
ncbi:RDD family protein [Maritalea mobilis]|uniref:RDD family protein n=1 Tax=Maritalea mobilis TaxID=483324 RepID=A0A4R6VJF4_9HYPH|nr:RDD family protein [Maritalea mobilis]TDQ61718.1 RDD family protein [Maritalea mobilis]